MKQFLINFIKNSKLISSKGLVDKKDNTIKFTKADCIDIKDIPTYNKNAKISQEISELKFSDFNKIVM